jgi:aminoglycoside phosphotransferase (APT) family kinase protein
MVSLYGFFSVKIINMNQPTPAKILEQEQQLIRKLAKLSDEVKITFNDIGWDSRVYIVNEGQFIFKFPRTERTKHQYKDEIPALRLVSQIKADVGLPTLLWEHPNNDYLGYKGVPGVSVDTIATALDANQKQVIGKCLGDFLVKLHKLDLPGARTMTIEDEIKQFQQNYTDRQPEIHKVFSSDEYEKLRTFMFDTMPARLTELGGDTVLCHGDLGYWNIIYGPGDTIGVIDFGDIGYYDRSKDFIGLEDEEALDAALAVYGDSHLLRQKIAVRQTALRIMDVPYYNGQFLTDMVVKVRAAIA